MKQEGPYLEQLTHRLAECPQDFLAAPVIAGAGQVDVLAVVCDLLHDLSVKIPTGEWSAKFGAAVKSNASGEVNRLKLILLACWLFSDDWFKEHAAATIVLPSILADGFNELAAFIKADSFVSAGERREEFCRHCLALLSFRPAGESEIKALDQLAALSSVERSRVVEEARSAHARAEQIRKAMAAKAAEEAAAKASRE